MCIEIKSKVFELTESWKSGRISELEVIEKAEFLLEEFEDEDLFSAEDPLEVLKQIVLHLSTLHFQLVVKSDCELINEVVAMLGFNPKAAWEKWNSYWNSIDYDKRSEELKYNPIYVPRNI